MITGGIDPLIVIKVGQREVGKQIGRAEIGKLCGIRRGIGERCCNLDDKAATQPNRPHGHRYGVVRSIRGELTRCNRLREFLAILQDQIGIGLIHLAQLRDIHSGHGKDLNLKGEG